MKKFRLLITLILCMFFTSCEKGINPMLASRLKELNSGEYQSVEDKAEANFELIMQAIENQDKETLKNMFSYNALSSMDDFDSSFQEFIGFIDGDIVSWEMSKNHHTSKHSKYGEKSIEITTSGYITTESQKYRIYVDDCIIDDFDDKNRGVTTVMIKTSNPGYVGETTPGLSAPQLGSEYYKAGYADFEKIAKDNFESVSRAIMTQDFNALKEVYSEKSLSEKEDLELRFQSLFDTIGTNIVSCEFERQITTEHDKVELEEKYIEIKTYGKLTTEREEYKIEISDFVIDELDNTNCGVSYVIVSLLSDVEIWVAI